MRYARKLFVVLLVAAVCLCPAAALAEGQQATVALSIVDEAPYYLSGDSLQVQVSLSADTALTAGSLELDIAYDPELLYLASPSQGPGWYRTIIEPGLVKLVWFLDGSTLTLDQTGLTAAVLDFTVKSGGAGISSTALTLGREHELVSADGNATVTQLTLAEPLTISLSMRSLAIVSMEQGQALIDAAGLAGERDYLLYLAAYDDRGRMTGVLSRSITAAEVQNAAWEGQLALGKLIGAAKYRAMLLFADGSYAPAVPAAEK